MFVRAGRQMRLAIGTSMRRKRAQRLYPSERAASVTERGRLSSPERKASMHRAPPKRLSDTSAQSKAESSGTLSPVAGSVTRRPIVLSVK